MTAANDPGCGGRLSYTVTFLEMTAPPNRPPPPHPSRRLALLAAEGVPRAYYLYLFRQVGEPWLWSGRLSWTDRQLDAWLATRELELFVLYLDGWPAGFAELHTAADGSTCNIEYLGLVPQATGRGLGTFFLDTVVDLCWAVRAGRPSPRKVTVNTCDHDHPRALAAYQRAGFVPIRREVQTKPDPRLLGLYPKQAAPQIPLGR